MKLLGWMHRKIRQTNNELLKDFSISHSSCIRGQPSIYDHPCPKTSKSFKEPWRDNLGRSFACIQAAKTEEEDNEEEPSTAISKLFQGFLATGNLGSDPNISEPSTPTFSISAESIMEKETDIIDDEIKLMNDGLVTHLEGESKEDGNNDSSRRSSHVSTGRSRNSSTITHSGKPTEGPETNWKGVIVCPLRGHLYRSATKLSKTTMKSKKECRTTLGELLQRTKIEENCGGECGQEIKRTEKEADKSAVHILKKMKKNMIHASKRSSIAAADGHTYSTSEKTKLHKILNRFHKKVHPESPSLSAKRDKYQKHGKKKGNMHDAHNNKNQMHADKYIMVFSKEDHSKEKIKCHEGQSDSAHVMLRCNDPNWKKEYWTNTDADYFVLELQKSESAFDLNV